MTIQACLLMQIPAEVRLVIYKYLFSNSDPIDLNINGAGYISFTHRAKLNLSSLRTCKRFYLEACPVLYSINTFTIMFKDVASLVNMRQGSRMCIENMIIEPQPGILAIPVTLPTLPFQARRPRTDTPPREVLDLSTIGSVFSGLQNLVIRPSTASAFLAIVLQLSRSLPCSPIRDWPVLEVIVRIKQLRIGDFGTDNRLCLTTEHLKLLSINRQLSALSQTSNLGLGHEMPDLKTIRVEGHLTWEDCQLLEEHKSSFGDCSFGKEIIHSSVAHEYKDSRYKYTWRRVDEDEQHAQAINATVEMHQWVPRLTNKDYLIALASFGAVLEAE